MSVSLVALGVSTGSVVCLGWTGSKLLLSQNHFLCFSAHLFWVVALYPLGNHFLPLVGENPASLNTHLSIVTTRAS